MESRRCTKCGKVQPLKCFSFRCKEKNIRHRHCKTCSKKDKIVYYNKNKTMCIKKCANYIKNNPWIKIFANVRYRCNTITCHAYSRYGGRGIKCLITSEELKELWFRDKAYEMKKPSIDRIDNDGNYCFENCRFIEQSENSSRARQENMKIIQQFDKSGIFIKEWVNIKEIIKNHNISSSYIYACCRGERKTSKGYIWRYKDA